MYMCFLNKGIVTVLYTTGNRSPTSLQFSRCWCAMFYVYLYCSVSIIVTSAGMSLSFEVLYSSPPAIFSFMVLTQQYPFYPHPISSFHSAIFLSILPDSPPVLCYTPALSKPPVLQNAPLS